MTLSGTEGRGGQGIKESASTTGNVGSGAWDLGREGRGTGRARERVATTGNIGSGTGKYREILETFDERSLPDLDAAVLGALEFFEKTPLPEMPFSNLPKPLVVGSGNAAVVGRLLFDEAEARFADESTYERVLAIHRNNIESAVVISASGGKDAVRIAETFKKEKMLAWLITTNADASAREYLEPERVLVFPKNREPYTYNTSTYMGMILSKTHEDPAAISAFITGTVAHIIPETLAKYDAFYFILPQRFIGMKDMLLTKFDELFGARVTARANTLDQTKHSKTVVPSDTECFVSIGEENSAFGAQEKRIHIPLSADAGYAAMMAVGYYVIGQIQQQHPPYFKDNIGRYVEESSKLFGQHIPVIVE